MLKNIHTYGDFYKGICLEDNKSKSLEYIKANPNKKYLVYFSNNTKKPKSMGATTPILATNIEDLPVFLSSTHEVSRPTLNNK